MRPPCKLVALLVAMFCAMPVVAVCVLHDYSVASEFSRSSLVAFGTVISEAPVADAQGPAGIGGTTYVVKIGRIFRGRTTSTINLFSENSSGRFPMQVGRTYILFVSHDDGTYSVDNCGNSTDVEHGGVVIASVRKLAGDAGT